MVTDEIAAPEPRANLMSFALCVLDFGDEFFLVLTCLIGRNDTGCSTAIVSRDRLCNILV
jgi:hypothetical protein